MNTYERRLSRVELDMGRECVGGCVKCLLVRITAEQNGQQWAGCDKRPVGLVAILSQLQAEAV